MGDFENEKLCKLVKKGVLEKIKKLKKYGDIVKNPHYLCVKCGRTAFDKKNLCQPEKL